MENLRSHIQSGELIVLDGGMATALYDRGFYINRNFAELSCTQPDAVREVTQGFKNSGAQVLHTNTFGATRPKLVEHGIQDLLGDIIKASCKIARDVADSEEGAGGSEKCYVAGHIGPLGVVLEPLGPTGFDEAEQMYSESVDHFLEAGVDAFSLSSFHDFNELRIAIEVIQKKTDLPIMAHIAIQESMKTSYGYSLGDLARMGDIYNLDAIGVSGEVGPSGSFTALEKLVNLTDRPISIQPGAGLPRYVNDEYIYLCNPDYIAKYSKRMVQAGAQLVGGTSGVHPEHIFAISNAVKMIKPQPNRIKGMAQVDVEEVGVEPEKLAEKSKLGRYLEEGTPFASVELNPPKGVDCSQFFVRCQQLQDSGVEFVNIPDGARAMARMSSTQMSAYVAREFDLEPIPHFTSRDRNLLGIQSDLLGAYVNGVKNLLLVTGDPPKLGNCPDATAVYDVDAIGMTHIVSRMNRGLDLGGTRFGKPAAFTIGVALNPTTNNLDLEVDRFRYKMEAGAEYAITQPIYDLEAYNRFFDKLGGNPIPIIMGVWPLVSLRNAEFLKHEVPGVEVPDWVIESLEKAGDDKEEALKRGLEIAISTMEKAKHMVAGFQVAAPFNKAEIAIEAIHSLGLQGSSKK